MRSENIGVCRLRICRRIRTALQAWNRNNVTTELGFISFPKEQKAAVPLRLPFLFSLLNENTAMPHVGNHIVENLRPFKALSKGYLTSAEYMTQYDWEQANFEDRHSVTFVYVDGEYKGVSRTWEKLSSIIEKFKII